jgi:hypothetical protein
MQHIVSIINPEHRMMGAGGWASGDVRRHVVDIARQIASEPYLPAHHAKVNSAAKRLKETIRGAGQTLKHGASAPLPTLRINSSGTRSKQELSCRRGSDEFHQVSAVVKIDHLNKFDANAIWDCNARGLGLCGGLSSRSA